jgi:hypothetical protein
LITIHQSNVQGAMNLAGISFGGIQSINQLAFNSVSLTSVGHLGTGRSGFRGR